MRMKMFDAMSEFVQDAEEEYANHCQGKELIHNSKFVFTHQIVVTNTSESVWLPRAFANVTPRFRHRRPERYAATIALNCSGRMHVR